MTKNLVSLQIISDVQHFEKKTSIYKIFSAACIYPFIHMQPSPLEALSLCLKGLPLLLQLPPTFITASVVQIYAIISVSTVSCSLVILTNIGLMVDPDRRSNVGRSATWANDALRSRRC